MITDLKEFHSADKRVKLINLKETQTERSNTRKGIFLPNLITNGPSSKSIQKPEFESISMDNEEIKLIILTEERTEDEAKQLYEHIKSFSFFEMIDNQYPGYHFGEPALVSLCSKLKYEKHIVNKLLFKEGDSTNGKVYLLYSGEVSLYQKNLEPGSPEQKEGSLGAVNGTFQGGRLSKGVISSFESSPKMKSRLAKPKTYNAFGPRSSLEDLDNALKYGTLIKTFRAGDVFGEQALFTWEKRPFTAVTNGPCELLVLGRHDFHQIKGKFDEKRKKIYDFMENFIPKFSDISYQLFEELVQLIEERFVERGTYLTVEGEPCDSIYMIYEGSCEFLKNVRLDETLGLKDPLISLKQLLRIGPVHTESIPICNVNRGTFIGDEGIYREEGTYNFSVRMVSGVGTIFVINKENFINKFPEIVQEELGSLFKAKSKHYAENIKNTIAQKYPQMEILSLMENTPSSKKTNESQFLAQQIMLIPTKYRKLNPQARSGLFRSKNSLSGLVPGNKTPEMKRKILYKVENQNISQENTLDASNSPFFKGREDLGSHTQRRSQSKKTFSDFVDKINESDYSKNDRSKELEHLKNKVSRTYVNSEVLVQGENYVSSSPVKKTRNMIEVPGSGSHVQNQNIIPSSLYGDYGWHDNKEETQRKFSARNRMNSVTNKAQNTERQEESPLFSRYEGNRLHNLSLLEGRFKRFRNRSIETVRNQQQHIEEKAVNLDESFMELRKLLLGKVANSKEFLMARKRLNKSQQNKLQVETERDVSLGKRLGVLFKLLHDRQKRGTGLPVLATMRSSRGKMKSESPLKSLATTRVFSSVYNDPFSPLSPIKRNDFKHDDEEGQKTTMRSGNEIFKGDKIPGFSQVINETISKSTIEVETLNNFDINDSIEVPMGSTMSVRVLKTNDAIKLKNAKRMALLRYKSGRVQDGSPKTQEPGSPKKNTEKIHMHGPKQKARFQIYNASNVSKGH